MNITFNLDKISNQNHSALGVCMNVAERLRKVLEERGITQYQLADMVGSTQGAISNIIAGKTKKPRNLLEIANAVGVDPNWLQNGGDVTISSSGNGRVNMGHSQIHNNQGQTVNNNFFGSGSQQVNSEPHSEEEIEDWIFRLNITKLSHVDVINNRLPRLFESMHLSDDGLIELLKLRSAKNIAMLSMFDHSMTPQINLRDVILIDTTYNRYSGIGIYLFIFNSELFVRQLLRTSEGELKAIAGENGYSFDIEADHLDKIQVLGKCIRKMEIKSTEL